MTYPPWDTVTFQLRSDEMPSANELLRRPAHRSVTLRPWAWSQGWRNLLFAHWSIPPNALRPHVPASLEIDTFEGSAWVSVVAFRMRRVRPRWLPPFPPVSDFLELNLRTYVRLDDKPGVFFLSIHASKRLAVYVARRLSPLPYVFARMELQIKDEGYRFHCDCDGKSGQLLFAADYIPSNHEWAAAPGSLDDWLLERYRLYASDKRGVLVKAEIHHVPWSIRHANLRLERNSLGQALGLDLSTTPDCVHFSTGVKALAGSFESVGNETALGQRVTPVDGISFQ
jgi:uncharacterized protein YqjF (DUF2071 family)